MKELKEALQSLIKLHDELVTLLQQEREALILFYPSEIERLAREKDMLLMKIRLFEEERIKLMDKITRINNYPENMTLSKLVEITGDEEYRELGLKLLSLVQSVIELNEFNKILVERSSRHVNSFLNFLENNGFEHARFNKTFKA